MHPLFRKWFLIFLAFLFIGVIGASAAVGALLGYINALPPIDQLENYDPPEISRVFDRTGNTQLAEFFSERREVVRYAEIPEHVINAFLAIEDERFYDHFGIDFRGLARAFYVNFTSGGKVQGASTITMQVARNVVLLDTRKTISRKLKEILLSLQIERFYSKEQILEFYLNQIFFGAQSYGIQAAARSYFNKDIKDLTIPEAAMIAGLPKAPSQLSPFRDKEAARDRRNLVLFNMHKTGFIKTLEERDRYMAMPIELNPAPRPKTHAPYYVDYVRSLLMKDNSMQSSSELGSKGYTIISSVDLNLQKICEEELSKALREVEEKIEEQKSMRAGSEDMGSVRQGQARLATITAVKEGSITVSCHGYKGDIRLPEKLPYFNPEKVIKVGNKIDIYINSIDKKGKLSAYLYDKTHVQGGVVLLDAKTGEIMALVGGDDYDDPVNNGQWNRAVQGGRQPGSCWKPPLYAAAFDVKDSEGNPRFTPGTVITDEPVSYANNYSPKNYEGKFYGATTLYLALIKSRNIPTIKLFMDIGPKQGVRLYHMFNTVNHPSNWELYGVPSMPLGTPNVTPLELCGVYSILANGGVGIKPMPMKRLYSSKSPGDSRIIKPEQQQVITPQAAYLTTRILQDVITRGTGSTTVGKWYNEQTAKGRKIPELAGKTGTTNDCYVAWFCGYTPELVMCVYVGYDQHRSMGPKMTGGVVCGPIWANMMDRILQTRNDWKMKFDVPEDIEFRDICSRSGQLVAGGCGGGGSNDIILKNAAFKKGTAPTGTCNYHGGSGGGGYYEGEEDPEAQYNFGQTAQGQAPASPQGAYGYQSGYQPNQQYNYQQQWR